MGQLIKDQVVAYQKRWQMVNEAEIQELRNTSRADKLRKTAMLMVSAQAMGWNDAVNSDEVNVWERWQKLREKYHG
ncbi:MAG: hypothetical protein D6813_04925 [Calditrichaeota bacterium]|nr:MAG: hypothetical protein D6813_04925 [Calditrichota bacterium]